VLGISGGDPSFRGDDGSAEPDVAAALGAFAAGEGSEHAVLTALAGSRLLVPVIAVLADQAGAQEADVEHADGPQPGSGGRRGKKASEMAMPTLIGLDGRRAMPAFTCLDSLRRWRSAARPVPAPARQVWRAATDDSCAVVIDVAGPVRLAVEGARLAALARGDAVPAAWADPDVREIVSDVLAGELAVAAFDLRPGDPDHDLVIALTLARDNAGRDIAELAAGVGDRVMTRLGARLRRGVAIWLGG
jgi:type III secretion system (T3SS) SseB-like protein